MREGGLTRQLSVVLAGKLSGRLDLLRRSVKQASIGELEEQVAKLMLAWPVTGGHSEIDAMLRVRQYAEDLLGTPLWAVRSACQDVSRGSVPGLNRDFPPSSPRLRELVDGYVSAVHKEAREIKEVLQAPQVPPDDPEKAAAVKKLIGEGLRSLVEVMRAKDAQFAGPPGPTKAPFKPLSIAECAEIYKTRRLPGMPAHNVAADVTRDDGSDGTSHE